MVALALWFKSQVRHLESQFNARNGNQSKSIWVDKKAALDAHAVDYAI